MRAQSVAVCFCVLLLALSGPAGAQRSIPIGIGTSPQGTATYSMGSALARLLDDVTELRATVQPNSGTGVMIPLVNAGELDVGFANAIEVTNAYRGEGDFSIRNNERIRLIARLMPLRVGLFVRDDSDIRSLEDLRGRRVPYEFASAPVLNQVITAILANGGLTPDDIEQVRVPTLIRGANEFVAGNTDVGFFAVGAGKVSEIDATVGGIRFIPINLDRESIRRMHEVLPVTYPFQVFPAPNLAGIDDRTPVMAYDYLVFAGAHVPDSVVQEITDAIANNQEHLANSFPLFRLLVPRNMAVQRYDIPFHSGAIRYYRQAGLWR